MSKIIKGILFLVLILAIAWGGTCVYSNFFAKPDTGIPNMPESSEAAYSVHIKNTGGLLLTDKYEEMGGNEVGSRVFVLHGYWEVQGKDFKYKSNDIILPEATFGEINIRRRK